MVLSLKSSFACQFSSTHHKFACKFQIISPVLLSALICIAKLSTSDRFNLTIGISFNITMTCFDLNLNPLYEENLSFKASKTLRKMALKNLPETFQKRKWMKRLVSPRGATFSFLKEGLRQVFQSSFSCRICLP